MAADTNLRIPVFATITKLRSGAAGEERRTGTYSKASSIPRGLDLSVADRGGLWQLWLILMDSRYYANWTTKDHR